MVALVIDSSGSRQQRAFNKGNNIKTYETYVSLSIWFEASGSNPNELKLILEPSVSKRQSMAACTHCPLATSTDDEIKT